jgi:hypothetical protein
MNYIYDIKAPCGLFLGGDYRATDIANYWYTMDGLNSKKYIRNPILIESTIYINLIKPCFPHPSVLDTNFKILSVLSILIWGRNVI